jgi:pimeloyl-ACP methyl ester carboxylesterase
MTTMLMALALAAAEVTIPGPKGPLAGTLVTAGEDAPVVVVIPGSGPTDRDGNNPMGVTAAPYRLLAEALVGKGVSTLRIDKRGLFGSKAAGDPNDVTIAAYAADVRGWAAEAARRTGRRCAWLLGHSEGGLVALAAAQDPKGICGVVLVATPGRPLGQVMREQLRANPGNAPILALAMAAIDSLEAGRRVDPATLPPPLPMLFPAAVQGFMIDLFAQKPAALAAALRVPTLIVQGDRDLQVSVEDARSMSAAAPAAKLVVLPGVNHVLKPVADDPAANMAAYRDPSIPVATGLVDAVAAFVTAR